MPARSCQDMPARHDKIEAILIWPDSKIISIDSDFSTTTSELTNMISCIFQ